MGRAAIGPAGKYSRALAGEIRAELGRRGMTTKELAEQSGLKPTYLGDRLRDTAPLNLNDIEAIATAFDLRPIELMQRAEDAVDKLGADDPTGPTVTGRGTFTGRSSDARVEELKRRAGVDQRSS